MTTNDVDEIRKYRENLKSEARKLCTQVDQQLYLKNNRKQQDWNNQIARVNAIVCMSREDEALLPLETQNPVQSTESAQADTTETKETDSCILSVSQNSQSEKQTIGNKRFQKWHKLYKYSQINKSISRVMKSFDITQLLKALKKDRTSMELHVELGLRYARLQKSETAVRYLSKATHIWNARVAKITTGEGDSDEAPNIIPASRMFHVLFELLLERGIRLEEDPMDADSSFAHAATYMMQWLGTKAWSIEALQELHTSLVIVTQLCAPPNEVLDAKILLDRSAGPFFDTHLHILESLCDKVSIAMESHDATLTAGGNMLVRYREFEKANRILSRIQNKKVALVGEANTQLRLPTPDYTFDSLDHMEAHVQNKERKLHQARKLALCASPSAKESLENSFAADEKMRIRRALENTK